MKMARTIIILIVVLGVVLGAFLAVRNLKPKDADQADKLSIFTTDKDNIVEATIKSAKGTLTLYKEKDVWKAKGAEDTKLNQTKADDLAYYSSSLEATELVEENPKNIEQYGFNNPTATAEIKLKDGTVKTFLVGNEIPGKNGYYFMEKDGDKVFTVWVNIGETFSMTLDDLREKALAELKEEDLVYFHMTRKDRPSLTLQYTPQSEMGMTNWSVTEPYQRSVDTEQLTKTLEAIANMKVRKVVDSNPADLAQYGLAEPNTIIEARDKNGKSLKLALGKEADEETLYCMPDGTNIVYTIGKETVTFKDLPAFAFADKFSYIINIETVDKLSVQGLGRSGNLEITHKETKTDNGETEKEESFALDGKKVEEGPSRAFYQEVIGLQNDGEVEKEVTGTADITIVFQRNRDPKTVTIEYIPYDLDNYAVKINGNAHFYINKDKLVRIIDKLKLFQEGKLE